MTKQTTQVWLDVFTTAAPPSQLLPLLYLANDVIQESRYTTPVYLEEFLKVHTKQTLLFVG